MYFENVKPSEKGNSNESEVDSETEDVPDEADADEQNKNEDVTPGDSAKINEIPIAEEIQSDEDYEDKGEENNTSVTSSDSEEDEVPDNYLFPSYMAFVLWGPYVEPDKRISLILMDDSKITKGLGSRKQKRALDKEEKALEAKVTNSNDRGFSKLERIEIDSLNIRKQEMLDRQKESTLVGFSIEESAVSRLIEQAERRAEVRCPTYNSNNLYWQKVDLLLEKQETILTKMHDFNSKPPQETPGNYVM